MPEPFRLALATAQQERIARYTVTGTQLAAVLAHRDRQDGLAAFAMKGGHSGSIAQMGGELKGRACPIP